MAGEMSYSQIEQLWIANGGNKTWAPLFAAIAMAESGGNSTALNNNPSTGDYSVGLWQINYFGSLLGPRTAQYGAPAQLQSDANAQAKAAIELSNNGTNLGPWKTDAVAGAVLNGQPIPTQYTNGQHSINIPANPNSPTDAGGCQKVGPNLPVVGQIFTNCSVAEGTGVALMLGGGLLAFVGVALIAAAMGTGRLRGAPGKLTEGLLGADLVSQRRTRKAASQRQSDQLELIAARNQEKRYPKLGSLPSDSEPL